MRLIALIGFILCAGLLTFSAENPGAPDPATTASNEKEKPERPSEVPP